MRVWYHNHSLCHNFLKVTQDHVKMRVVHNCFKNACVSAMQPSLHVKKDNSRAEPLGKLKRK